MTREEAIALVLQIREVAIKQEIDQHRLDRMEAVLLPLPYQDCLRNAARWTTAVQTDEKGQPLPKFVSTPDEILAVVGVDGRARSLVDRAIAEGGTVWPSLRDVGREAIGGWAYVAPDAPLPRGVGEFYANLGLPPPDGRPVSRALPGPSAGPSPRALPSGGEPRSEPLPAGQAIATIGRQLAQAWRAQDRRAFEVRRHPPSREVALDDLPPALQAALEATEAEHAKLVEARRRCEAQERAYRELCAEMADRVRDGAPDAESARAVAVELLERIAADPLGGIGAALEVVRDALVPGGRLVAPTVTYAPNPDPFDERPGPVAGLRLAITRST